MIAWALLVAVVAAACAPDETPSGDLSIVVTTTVLGDVIRNIVGEGADVEVLMPTGIDPHDFQASAQQVRAIQLADLVVANGLGLEEGLRQVLASAELDGANVFEIGPHIDPESMTRGSCDPSSDEHSEESGCDPHIWLDPVRMAQAAGLLANELNDVDPSQDWAAAAKKFAEMLLTVDTEIKETLAVVSDENRILVTNHDAFGYFAERYEFDVIGTVVPGGSTLGEPSSAELAALVATIREHNAPAIFVETTQSRALAQAVAAEVGYEIAVIELYTGSLGSPETGADSLIGLLKTNAKLIAGALS